MTDIVNPDFKMIDTISRTNLFVFLEINLKGTHEINYVRNDYVISNDGKHIVFVGVDETTSPATDKLILTDAIAENSVLLSEKMTLTGGETAFEQIKISKDSKKIVYIEKEEVMPITLDVITTVSDMTTTTFTMKDSDVERRLFTYNIETDSAARELTNPMISKYVSTYEISPDCSYLVFGSYFVSNLDSVTASSGVPEEDDTTGYANRHILNWRSLLTAAAVNNIHAFKVYNLLLTDHDSSRSVYVAPPPNPSTARITNWSTSISGGANPDRMYSSFSFAEGSSSFNSTGTTYTGSTRSAFMDNRFNPSDPDIDIFNFNSYPGYVTLFNFTSSNSLTPVHVAWDSELSTLDDVIIGFASGTTVTRTSVVLDLPSGIETNTNMIDLTARESDLLGARTLYIQTSSYNPGDGHTRPRLGGLVIYVRHTNPDGTTGIKLTQRLISSGIYGGTTGQFIQFTPTFPLTTTSNRIFVPLRDTPTLYDGSSSYDPNGDYASSFTGPNIDGIQEASTFFLLRLYGPGLTQRIRKLRIDSPNFRRIIIGRTALDLTVWEDSYEFLQDSGDKFKFQDRIEIEDFNDKEKYPDGIIDFGNMDGVDYVNTKAILVKVIGIVPNATDPDSGADLGTRYRLRYVNVEYETTDCRLQSLEIDNINITNDNQVIVPMTHTNCNAGDFDYSVAKMLYRLDASDVSKVADYESNQYISPLSNPSFFSNIGSTAITPWADSPLEVASKLRFDDLFSATSFPFLANEQTTVDNVKIENWDSTSQTLYYSTAYPYNKTSIVTTTDAVDATKKHLLKLDLSNKFSSGSNGNLFDDTSTINGFNNIQNSFKHDNNYYSFSESILYKNTFGITNTIAITDLSTQIETVDEIKSEGALSVIKCTNVDMGDLLYLFDSVKQTLREITVGLSNISISRFQISPRRVLYISDQEQMGKNEVFGFNIEDNQGVIVTKKFNRKLPGIETNTGVENVLTTSDDKNLIYVGPNFNVGLTEIAAVPFGGNQEGTVVAQLNGKIKSGGTGVIPESVKISNNDTKVIYLSDREVMGEYQLYSSNISTRQYRVFENGYFTMEETQWF